VDGVVVGHVKATSMLLRKILMIRSLSYLIHKVTDSSRASHVLVNRIFDAIEAPRRIIDWLECS
jgi:hypothetical protein